MANTISMSLHAVPLSIIHKQLRHEWKPPSSLQIGRRGDSQRYDPCNKSHMGFMWMCVRIHICSVVLSRYVHWQENVRKYLLYGWKWITKQKNEQQSSMTSFQIFCSTFQRCLWTLWSSFYHTSSMINSNHPHLILWKTQMVAKPSSLTLIE